MTMQKQIPLRKANGMTLIESVIVIIIIGLLSAITIPAIKSFVTNARIAGTRREIKQLQQAIIGNPEEGWWGYRHDMQDLPDALSDLFTDPGTGYNTFTQLGWNGPYVDSRDANEDGTEDILVDGWGNLYDYSKAAGTITSYGPDGGAGGGDDIVVGLE